VTSKQLHLWAAVLGALSALLFAWAAIKEH
jgi:hypothetical protein